MNKTNGKKTDQEKFLEVIAEMVRIAGIEAFSLLAKKLPLDSLFYSLLAKGMTPQQIAAYLIANAEELVKQAREAERLLDIFKKENEPCPDSTPSPLPNSKTKKTKL